MHTKFLFRFTNLLFVAALVLLAGCSSSGQQTQPAIPTITPTYYFVQLPASVQSASGWKINLSALDLQTALGETKPKNKMFLVGLVEIENLTGKSGCIKNDQFMLQNGLQKIKMELGPLEAGKDAYARDYPGTILGQCLDANEIQESVLVFDIPATSEDLSLSFQKQTMRLGKIEAIQNPLPTLTPTETVIVPPTAVINFTATPTPKPVIQPTATIIPTSTLTPTVAKKFDVPSIDFFGMVGKNASELDKLYGQPDSVDLTITGDWGKDVLARGYYSKDGYSFFVILNDSRQVVDVVSDGIPTNLNAKLKEWNDYLSYFGVNVGDKQPDYIADLAIYWDNVLGKRVVIRSGMDGIIDGIKICDMQSCPVQHR